jgi:hypothetical protein
MRKRTTAAFIAAFIPVLALRADYRENRTYHESCACPSGTTVTVENVNGNIAVEAWDRDSVDAVAEVEFKGRRERYVMEVIDETSLHVSKTASGIRVRISRPKFDDEDFWGWLFHGGTRVNVNARLRIRVPASADLEAETTNGNTRVSGVRGDLNIGTTNGNVDAEETAGSVEASTTNGSVSVAVAAVPASGRLSCHSTNGEVHISLPAGKIDADVEMSTTNGQVKSSYPITMQGGFSGKHIRGTIGKGGILIRASTTNGNVELNAIP